MDIEPEEKIPLNYTRRTIGALIGFSPLFFLIFSLIYGINKSNAPAYSAIGLMLIALLLALINFYLSFIRSGLYERKNGSMSGYRFVSGIPIVASILIVLGSLIGFGAIGSAAIGILAFVLDTSGSGWFVIATWRDRTLWDVKK